VDAAENNPTALTLGRHAEVVKYFSMTEHTMVPDVLLVSRQTWDSLSERQRSIMKSAAQESVLLQSILWEQAEAESLSTARRMGIIFQDPDREAFARKLSPLKDECAAADSMRDLIARVERV
jgi:TRAP-type C4-dicarboxylate transport system substrate-binding protein